MDPMGMKKIEHAIKQTESDLDDARVNAPGVGDPPVNWDRAAWFGSRLRLSSSGAGGVALTSLKGDQLQLKKNITPDTTSLDADYGTFYLDDNWKLKKVKGTTEPAVSAIENLNEVGDIGTLTQTTGYLKKVSGVWELDTTLTSSTYNDDNVKTLLGSLEKSFWEGLDNLKGVIDDAVKAAKDALDALVAGINGVLDVIGRTVGEVWGNIVDWVTAQASRILDFGKKVWASLISQTDWLKDQVWTGIRQTISWLKENILATAKGVWDAFWNWVFELTGNDAIDTTSENDPDDIPEFNWIKNVRTVFKWVSDTIEGVVDFVIKFWQKLFGEILKNGKAILNLGLGTASAFWNWIFGLTGTDAVDWRLDTSENAPTNNSTEIFWLRNLRIWLKPIFSGIKTGLESAWEFLKNIGSSVWNWLLGLGAPTSTTDPGGRNWLTILHNALKTITAATTDAAKDLWRVVTKFWDSIVANGSKWVKGLEEGFKEGSTKVREAISKGGSTLSADIQAVYDFFGEGFNVIFGKPTSTESPSVTGATTGDIDVKTFDLRRVDRIFFDSNDQTNLSSLSTPQISGYQMNLRFTIPDNKNFRWYVGSDNVLSVENISSSDKVSVHVPFDAQKQLKVGSWTSIAGMTKTTPGVFWLDGSEIKCYTGTKEVSLSDIGTGGGGSTPTIPKRRVTIPIRVSTSTPSATTLNSWFGSDDGSIGIVISNATPTQASQVYLYFKTPVHDLWSSIAMGSTLGAITTSGSNPTAKKRIMVYRTSEGSLHDGFTPLNDVKGGLSSNSADGQLGMYGSSRAGLYFCVFNSLLQYPPYRRISAGPPSQNTWTAGTLGQLPNGDLPDEKPATLDQYFGEDNGSMGLDIDSIYVKVSGRWFTFSLTYGGELPIPPGSIDLTSVKTDIIPTSNEAKDLGSDGKQWAKTYTKELYIDGNKFIPGSGGGGGSPFTGGEITSEIYPDRNGTINLGKDTGWWKYIYANGLYLDDRLPTPSSPGTGKAVLYMNDKDKLAYKLGRSNTEYVVGSGSGGSSTNIPWGAVPQDLLPDEHADHNLGRDTKRWQELHVNAIWLNGARLTAAGTTPVNPGGGGGPDPVTGQVRIPYSPSMTFSTVTATRLDSLFGSTPGAIGCADQQRISVSSQGQSNTILAVRLSQEWVLLRPTNVLSRGDPDQTAHTTTQTANYLERTSEKLPVNDATSGVADPHRRFIVHEDTDDHDDGSIGIVIRTTSGSSTTDAFWSFDISSHLRYSPDVPNNARKTTQDRTGTFSVLPVTLITVVTKDSLDTAFGTQNGSMGVLQTSLNTYFLYVKIGGWWCQYTLSSR